MCTCARLLPWYGISLRFSRRPLYSFQRPPVASPSTATLGPPRKPAGYVVFVFLGVVDHTRRSRARTHAHHRYLARTRKRFPHSDRDQIDERLRFVPCRYDTEIKGRIRERRAALRAAAAQIARLVDH